MKDLQQGVRYLAAATIVLYLAVSTLAVVGYLDSRARQADVQTFASQTRASLCTLRADLVTRIAASTRFLRQHPDGIAGIPAAAIRQSRDGQRRTVEALSGLRCPDG